MRVRVRVGVRVRVRVRVRDRLQHVVPEHLPGSSTREPHTAVRVLRCAQGAQGGVAAWWRGGAGAGGERTEAVPAVGSVRPHRMLIAVVLPAPG